MPTSGRMSGAPCALSSRMACLNHVMKDAIRLLRSDAYWECRVDGVAVEIREGNGAAVGKTRTKALASPAAARVFATKQVAAQLAKGYLAASLVFERVPWKEVATRVRVPGNGEQPDDIVLVHRGALAVPHNLELDYRVGLLAASSDDERIVGVLIEGSLTIAGALLNYEDDYGPFLQVTGDLVADAVATGGSQIQVDGDLRTGELIGVYNHGRIEVGGRLTAKVVASEHTVAAGSLDAVRYDGWGGTSYRVEGGRRLDDDPFDTRGVFAKAVLKGESVDLGKARRLAAEGKSILRDELVSVRAAFRKLVAKKLEAPEKVKSLALTMKDLRSLPEELFAFTRLEKLDLTHNQLRTLPEELGRLTSLRELRLRGNGLQRLPDSIGELVQLRLVDLPASLGRCVELRSVNLRNNPYSYVRRSFGGWRKYQAMSEVPEVLTRLPRLESLCIEDTLVRRMPTRAFESAALAKVEYEDTLLLAVDRTLHPQFSAPDAAKTRRWAVAHIRFWFDHEHIGFEDFFDVACATYDFAEVRALLAIVLDILIPAAAPYDEAIATFAKECAEIVRRLHWGDDGVRHARALFADLLEALAELDHVPPVLRDGVRSIFARHATG
jgi:Leucine rich repeat